MKKLAALFISIALILLTTTSCIKKNELNEAAIVQAIGIDLEDEEFVLTLQIYSPKGAGGTTAIDTSKNNSTVIETRGDTIAQAIKLATLLQGKTIFTGHNRILVLGKELCDNGIEQIFSYFNRSALTRQNVQVLMSAQSAKEVVTTNVEQGILAAETIENMVENGDKNGMSYQCPYYKLAQTMSTANGSGAIPIIKVTSKTPSESADKSIQNVNKLELCGTGIFANYHFVSSLNICETRGLLLLENSLEETLIVCETPEFGKVSVQIYSCKTALKPQPDGSFTLTATMRGRLDEVLNAQSKPLSNTAIPHLEESCEKQISSEINTAFSHITSDKSDFLKLSDRLLKKHISNPTSNPSLKTSISLQINRLGLESDEKF